MYKRQLVRLIIMDCHSKRILTRTFCTGKIQHEYFPHIFALWCCMCPCKWVASSCLWPRAWNFAVPVWYACRATSAAPMYFQSCGDYVDGGVMANNPSMTAWAEIQHYYARKQEAPPHISMAVSMGTGTFPDKNMGVSEQTRRNDDITLITYHGPFWDWKLYNASYPRMECVNNHRDANATQSVRKR